MLINYVTLIILFERWEGGLGEKVDWGKKGADVLFIVFLTILLLFKHL